MIHERPARHACESTFNTEHHKQLPTHKSPIPRRTRSNRLRSNPITIPQPLHTPATCSPSPAKTMLGITHSKWQLLTVLVAGQLLLSTVVHAFDSSPPASGAATPHRYVRYVRSDYPQAAQLYTSSHSNYVFGPVYGPRNARQYAVTGPQQRIPKQRGAAAVGSAVPSFRPLAATQPFDTSHRRRSDHQHAFNTSAAVGFDLMAAASSVQPSQPMQRPQRKRYIPLDLFSSTSSTDDSGGVNATNTASPSRSNHDEIQSRTDLNFAAETTTRSASRIVFPTSASSVRATDAAVAAAALKAHSDLTGRRSGIQFAAQSLKIEQPFQPQSYREDQPSNPHYQFPYSEELSPNAAGGGPEGKEQLPPVRYGRNVVFDSPQRPAAPPIPSQQQQLSQQQQQPTTAQQQQLLHIQQQQQAATFRDDVTKFGDVNGPVTTLQHRQFASEFAANGGGSDKLQSSAAAFFGRPYESPSGPHYNSYDEFSRSPRYYSAPPSKLIEYSDYPGPPRSRLITPWKSSRTPRVVFPQANDAAAFPTGAGSAGAGVYGSDNVVFR